MTFSGILDANDQFNPADTWIEDGITAARIGGGYLCWGHGNDLHLDGARHLADLERLVLARVRPVARRTGSQSRLQKESSRLACPRGATRNRPGGRHRIA